MKQHLSPSTPQARGFRAATRIAALTLTGLLAVGCAEDRTDLAVAPDLSRIEDGEGMLNVGGYRLHTAVYGKGAPTVVLLSGLEETTDSWQRVQPEIARWTRVVTYDRGGVGASELPRMERRSAEEIATELERLLKRADVKPPYILVAHSLSGYYARVFAARHPRLVAGMVFLDAQHEAEADLIRQIPGYEELLRQIAESLAYPGSQGEFLAQLLSADQARAAGALPRVPVAAVTYLSADDPERSEAAFLLHGEWVAQGSTGLHLTTENGHRVPVEDPAVTLRAIRWVLDNTDR